MIPLLQKSCRRFCMNEVFPTIFFKLMNVVMDLNKPPEEDESSILFMLLKDGKQISQVSCSNTPVKISESLHIKDINPAAYYPLKTLPHIYFHAASQNRPQRNEWQRFLNYLLNRDKVAVCQHGNCEFLIAPPAGQGSANLDCVAVAYRFGELPKDGESGEILVSADNRTRESVLVQGGSVPKSHTPALHMKGSQLIVKSEDACLRPQNSQSPSPRLVSGDATCAISRDYKEDSLDSCHPVKEQALYQTIYSLPGETMLAQGGSTPKPQTPALHREQSQVIVKSEDFRSARVSTEDACLRPQNSQSLSRGLVSGNATCTVSRDYRRFGLHNLHPAEEQALYERIYSLPKEPLNFKEHMHNFSAQIPLEIPHYMHNSSGQIPLETPCHSSREVEQDKLGTPRYSSTEVKQDKLGTDRVKGRYEVDPDFFNTLRHMHNGWPFGALAELIDNARDANASKLDISIQMEFSKNAGQKIPILSVIDNGWGMSHLDIKRMVSIGHGRPTKDNRDHIGRFGVGFKTGTMQLGKDAIVLTQCSETRSIAFLSRSYNENKKCYQDLDIPIITYRKEGGWMDFDLEVHSEAEAETDLKSIQEYSPFNAYTIGSKFASFAENGTGTHIYIYNLARWGSEYTLAWDEKCNDERNLKKKRDIWIRSKRVRKREGQISREVPLDYSLHSYLEVMFLNPRMKIYVQGTMVRTHPLAKSLNKTKVLRDVILEKNVELTLGRSQVEKERGNCGMFLYWHGRLIEAYKRVGGMVQSADMGRGVIGVIDVTDLMKVGDQVMILPTKQGFQDCEELETLEKWLGCKADEYWDENFDTLELRDNSKGYKPDNEWVQCNKCRKWRILDPSFNAENLPPEWFCFMPPYKGECDIPEQKVEHGVITVSAKRSSGGFSNARQSQPVEEMNVTPLDDSIVTTISNKGESEISTDSEDEPVVELPVAKRTFRRLRRGPPPSEGGIAKRSRVK
ncbi:uncharacterized protein LOC131076262 isoform X2 [Cryptomeria japonica]|uniref:uncharacterized protein LOC131076262 isoform X2 n=1 Tax=Cryptomeria japonica TaxID=3369 RepID=UPI0025AD2802|nr:uncharacterized protein LOC131076262 isoform X2 [Cryptomeria japonica]